MSDNVSLQNEMSNEAKSTFINTMLNAFSPLIKGLSTFIMFALYPASPIIFIIGMVLKVIQMIFSKIIQL